MNVPPLPQRCGTRYPAPSLVNESIGYHKFMETAGFVIFCLAIAGVIYWSIIVDDKEDEVTPADDEPQS